MVTGCVSFRSRSCPLANSFAARSDTRVASVEPASASYIFRFTVISEGPCIGRKPMRVIFPPTYVARFSAEKRLAYATTSAFTSCCVSFPMSFAAHISRLSVVQSIFTSCPVTVAVTPVTLFAGTIILTCEGWEIRLLSYDASTW